MLGLLNRKTLKSMAMNLYHELVRGRIYEGKHFGLNADDISQRTGLSIHVVSCSNNSLRLSSVAV